MCAKINPQTVIDAASLNISDLLSMSRYQIPEYQRDFVWKSDEIMQLWRDLVRHYKANSASEDLVTSPKAYFLGAMVVLDMPGVASPTMEVIDGQQRLVALSCISAVLSHLLQEAKQTGPASQMNAMVGHYTGGSFETRVQPFEADMRSFLRVSLLEKTTPADRAAYWSTDAGAISLLKPKKAPARNIKSALEGLATAAKAFFDECTVPADRIKRLNSFELLVAECVIILRIKALDHSTAYNLFESLNNRGMPLNQADLVKNEMLKCAANATERATITSDWSTIRDTLANYDISLPDFLHYSYMSRFGSIKAGDLFVSAKALIAKGALNYSQELVADVEALEELLTGNLTKWHQKTNDKLKDISEVLRIKLSYVALLAAHRIKGNDKDAFEELVKVVMNYGFRHLKVLEGSVASLSTEMAQVAKKIVAGVTAKDIGVYLESVCSDTLFVEAFTNVSFPQTKLGYYCVYYLEMEIMKGGGAMPIAHGDEQNLEHIMPKSPTAADWPAGLALKTKDKTEFKELLWRIGNLLPLPAAINKSIKNKGIAYKISNAAKVDYANQLMPSPKSINGFLGGATEWGKAHIEARQKDLATKYAVAAWPLK